MASDRREKWWDGSYDALKCLTPNLAGKGDKIVTFYAMTQWKIQELLLTEVLSACGVGLTDPI